MNIPEINKTYNCFDDGKIRKSRLYKVKVIEIIPFKDIDSEYLALWKENVETCYWLYSSETDVFIKTLNDDNEEELFARTKDNGWFSIGGFLWCGRLDVDGSLTKILNND